MDFRPLSRRPDICLTTVTLYPDWDPGNRIYWIKAGQVSLRQQKESSPDGSYMLTCYVKEGATDGEHDSAYLFQLPLIGLNFSYMRYQQTTFTAWIDPTLVACGDDFRMPNPNYDPFKAEDACKCTSCKGTEKHWIVPYLPPPNPKLYEKVKGMKVEIFISPVFPDDDE